MIVYVITQLTFFILTFELSFISFRIVGWGCEIGSWARVEGVPTELDPDRPHATTDNFYLFDTEGKLLPSKSPTFFLQNEKLLFVNINWKQCRLTT